MTRVGLIRLSTSNQGTRGVLALPSGVICNTLELPWRDNQPSISCIPAGEYRAHLRNSPRFGPTYHITDVPGRSLILIHAGNLAGDIAAGYRTHTEGCILVGKRFGTIEGQQAVLVSRPALREFMDALDGSDFTLVVMEELCGN